MKTKGKSEKLKVKSYNAKVKNYLKFFVSSFFVLFSVFSLVFFVQSAHAAVGINHQINFQGKLVDNNGLNVSDGSYSVVFSLYNGSSGGTAIWTETDNVTTSNGIFQVALGAVTSLPGNVDFNSDSLYLGIKVGTDAEMTPRIRFTAVPYAFNAEKLDGVVATQSATGFNLQGGTSSLSTLSFTNTGGALTFQPGVAEGLTIQSNGANGLTLDTGGAAAVNIGNTNATSFVFGKSANNPTFTFNNGSGGVSFSGSGLTTLGGNVQINGNNIQDSGAATRVTLGATTTLTNTTLTLSGTTSIGASSLSTFTMGGAGTAIGGTAAGSSLTLESTSGTGTSDFISFKTGSQVEQMRIDTNGNVGIGTNFAANAAKAQLDVRSDLGTLPIASLSGATAFAGLVVNNSGKGDLFTASSSGLSRFVITQNGAVGIGTRTPQATYLDISENPAAAFIPTADFVDIGNIAGQEPTASGVNALQLSWFAKPASGNVSSAQRINLTNNNTTTAGQAQGLRIVATGTGGTVNSDTVALFIDGLTNASTGTVNQNAIEIGANWDSSIFGDGDLRINAAGNIILATSSASTKIGINTTAPLATFDLRGNNGTQPVASISGKTSFAGLVVNNSGNGDLMTASSGGQTRFRMTNNGSVVFQGDSLTSIGTGGTNTTSGAVENHIGDTGSLIPNPGFDSSATGVGFADGWAVAATNSAIVTRDTTVQAKGIASAKVTFSGASQSTAIYSTCIPLALQSGTGSYNLNFYAKPSVANKIVLRGYIDAYTSRANCQSNTTPTFSAAQGAGLSSTNWTTTGSGATAITFASGTNTWGKVHLFVGCPASCSGTTTVNIDGVRLIQNANSTGLDYAENYPADPTDVPEAGDVVTLEATNGSIMVARAHKYMDQSAIGVISTNPGEVLDDGSMLYPVPVALAGRVPVKVATSNGQIHVGDYLASSTIPGVAVKATGSGPVIGTAMEDDTDTNTSDVTEITMFVKNSYSSGNPEDTGLTLTSGAHDASILLSLLQEYNTASDSALTSLSTGQLAAGLNVLVSNLQQQLASSSSASQAVLGAATSDAQLGASSDGNATVSGDLRVKGNGLVEGVLHIVDTLFANNFIANGVSDFFGNVIFHSDITVTGKATVSSDTAGIAIISKGADHVDVKFSKPYDQVPVVNASLTVNPLTPTPNETELEQEQRLLDLEKTLLSDNIHFVVTKRSITGFTILLDKPADEDIAFSWLALAVQNSIIFQSSVGQSPTPTVGVSPSPIDTLMPTEIPASTSAGF